MQYSKEFVSLPGKAIHCITLAAAVIAFVAAGAPAQASQLDSRIESSAKNTHVFKTYLQKDDIKVASKEGAVTLTGSVSEDSHKSMAQETVAGLPGVKSVDNKLAVKGVPPSANSDAWLRDKVKFTLLFHRSVNAGATEVEAKAGVVTLRGNAESQAQKELTAEYAKDVDGVKEVTNEMVVAKTSKPSKASKIAGKVGGQVDDASITALVKLTLLSHRSTSALKTSVTTKKGVVSLTGKGANAAELALATELAGDVNGVKSVKNGMTVE